MSKPKIKTLSELVEEISRLKASGKKIVHCHGVYDLLHPGHFRHLEAAKKEGDILIVKLTKDEYVNKGPGRPVFNQYLRIETIAAIESVDYVALNEWATATEAIRLLKPDLYVKGSDYARRDKDLTGKIYEEEEAVRNGGGRIHFTDEVSFSSTNLINRHFGVFSPEVDAYLEGMRKQYSPEGVIEKLKSLSDMKVLIIGDTIIDQYHFCRPYGMASKSSAIAAQSLEEESYAGGVLAVANHVAGFCEQVDLVTCLGKKDTQEDFIRSHLKKNIKPNLYYREDAPTTVKKRYVSSFLLSKMFEVSFFNDEPVGKELQNKIINDLKTKIGSYDLVLVSDFGHGLMASLLTQFLSDHAKYLAVNTQLNSVNYGYNVITKYSKLNYICLDEEETRMAGRNRYGHLDEIVKDLAKRLGPKLMTVTRGHRGSVTFDGQKFYQSPVLGGEVVDTVGAGDAFLSLAAPCAAKGFDPELIGFIGNTVGALAVKIIGNKESVEPLALFRFITTLLK